MGAHFSGKQKFTYTFFNLSKSSCLRRLSMYLFRWKQNDRPLWQFTKLILIVWRWVKVFWEKKSTISMILVVLEWDPVKSSYLQLLKFCLFSFNQYFHMLWKLEQNIEFFNIKLQCSLKPRSRKYFMKWNFLNFLSHTTLLVSTCSTNGQEKSIERVPWK